MPGGEKWSVPVLGHSEVKCCMRLWLGGGQTRGLSCGSFRAKCELPLLVAVAVPEDGHAPLQLQRSHPSCLAELALEFLDYGIGSRFAFEYRESR